MKSGTISWLDQQYNYLWSDTTIEVADDKTKLSLSRGTGNAWIISMRMIEILQYNTSKKWQRMRIADWLKGENCPRSTTESALVS